MDTTLEGYIRFRDEMSRQADALFARYAPHLTCRRGCYYCCDEITVLPVELHALRRYLDEHGRPDPGRLGGPPEDRGETPQAIRERDERRSVDRSAYGTFGPAPGAQRRCAFLGREGECTVYEARPVICRTHGLPLAYRVYEYDQHGREISPEHPQYTDLWCDLNFTSLSERRASAWFDEHGRINMDAANRRIEELNETFLQSEAGRPYRDLEPGEDRQPLGVLLKPGRFAR